MKIKIQVTEEDIAKGLQSTPTSCPIAKSFGRFFSPYVSYLEVWPRVVRIGDHTKPLGFYSVSLPKKCTSFICAFDTGEPVKPFTFTIDL